MENEVPRVSSPFPVVVATVCFLVVLGMSLFRGRQVACGL